MNKEKQIDEMAKATMKHCEIDNQCGSCHWSTCNECLSEVLYNAGYRKQSEPISCGHEKGGEWISVDERLPEIGDSYIVVVKEKYKFETDYRYHVDVASFVFVDGYIDDVWDTFNDWYEGQEECHVTHWMPLPQPPKMKGGDNNA